MGGERERPYGKKTRPETDPTGRHNPLHAASTRSALAPRHPVCSMEVQPEGKAKGREFLLDGSFRRTSFRGLWYLEAWNFTKESQDYVDIPGDEAALLPIRSQGKHQGGIVRTLSVRELRFSRTRRPTPFNISEEGKLHQLPGTALRV